MIVLFFGDSLTLGTRDPEFRGWPGRLGQRALDAGAGPDALGFLNLGIRSNRSNDILARLAAEAQCRIPHPFDPDGRIVLSFGGADASAPQGLPRVDAATSSHNAVLLLEHATRLGPTLLIGPPPMADASFDARVRVLSMVYARAAAAAEVPYLDVHASLESDDAYRAELAHGDGVHPAQHGYDRIADIIHGWEPWRGWMREAGAQLP